MSMTNREAKLERLYAALTDAERAAVDAFLGGDERRDERDLTAAARAYVRAYLND
jgi:hypothetical protein